MKYHALLFLAFLISCSEEEELKKECQLTMITVKGSSFVTQTSYAYNAAGKMDKQVRTRSGTVIFDYTYSYNPDGTVDKIDQVDRYVKFEYADGKIASSTVFSKDGTLIGKQIYAWSGNNVEFKYIVPATPNPTQITALEFFNDNIVRKTIKSYTGKEPNTLQAVYETRYEDFDTALSAFFVASSTRPGSNVDISKNNPRKQIDIQTSYSNGVVVSESTTNTLFTYTYNASNAVLTSKATTDGANVVDTEITYAQCN